MKKKRKVYAETMRSVVKELIPFDLSAARVRPN